MLGVKSALTVCILATTIFLSVKTHAATYYVATTGNNSNPGTSSQPWRTVAYAVDRMSAGDTTYVRGGTYYGHVRFKRSGTQSAPIKLLNAPGEFPVIDCNNTSTQMVQLMNSSGIKYPIGWITIEGFEIRKCYNGIKMYNGHNVTIRRNWIHHNASGSGILGNGTKVIIDRNKINHNGRFAGCATTSYVCSQDHGIYMNGSANTITNNLIYDNLANGIQLNGTVSYDSARYAGPEHALSQNWIIANNTFAYQNYANGIVVWGSNCDNARIENNIFYENRVKGASDYSQGIYFSSASSSTGIVIRNNLAYASGSGGTKFLHGSAGYTQSSNIVNTIIPKFVNAPATLPSSPNFALTSGSPAIDKGLSLSITATSYPGTTRPQLSGFDVGAYEYYGSSTSLAAPTSLQVAN